MDHIVFEVVLSFCSVNEDLRVRKECMHIICNLVTTGYPQLCQSLGKTGRDMLLLILGNLFAMKNNLMFILDMLDSVKRLIKLMD